MRNWRSRSCFKGQHLIQKESAEGKKPARSSLLLYHIAAHLSVHQGNANCFCSWITDTHTPHGEQPSPSEHCVSLQALSPHHTPSARLWEGVFEYFPSKMDLLCCFPPAWTVSTLFPTSQCVFAVISCSCSQLYWLEECKVCKCGAGITTARTFPLSHMPLQQCVNITGSVTAFRDPCKGTSKARLGQLEHKKRKAPCKTVVSHRLVQCNKKLQFQTVSLLKCHCLSSSLHKWGSTVNY